jgi:uncharacterized small protein (DUF1192 family)
MSFDDTCTKCGRHLYAFCTDAIAKKEEHWGWGSVGEDEVLCVGCMIERIEALQNEITDAKALVFNSTIPRTVDDMRDTLDDQIGLLNERAALRKSILEAKLAEREEECCKHLRTITELYKYRCPHWVANDYVHDCETGWRCSKKEG